MFSNILCGVERLDEKIPTISTLFWVKYTTSTVKKKKHCLVVSIYSFVERINNFKPSCPAVTLPEDVSPFRTLLREETFQHPLQSF